MTIVTGGPGDVTLAPGDRAAAIAEVKAILRVAAAGEDALIAAFAETALGLAERFTGRVLIARAMIAVLPVSRAWQAAGAVPVRAITGVAALDAAGVATPLAAEAYAIDIDAAGEGWIRVIAGGGAARVSVTFEAGVAGGWAAIPMPIRQGIVLLAAHLFSERDEHAAPPAAITALWRPFRVIGLTSAARAC